MKIACPNFLIFSRKRLLAPIRLGLILVGVVLVGASLSACARQTSFGSLLKDRFSRDPESQSLMQDGDFRGSPINFREELDRTRAELETSYSEAGYYFLRGEVLVSRERYQEALEAYKNAEAKLSSPSSVLSKRIIQLTLKEGNLAEAVKTAENYRQRFPGDVDILEILAGAYSAVGRGAEAIAVYSELVNISEGKKREEFAMLLASAYAQSKDFVGAKGVLKNLLEENPKNPLAIYYLGRMFELEGDAAGAEKQYRLAVKETPENDGLQLELARFLAQEKNLKEAQKIAKMVVDRSPQNALARQLLGQLLLAANNIDGALSQLQTLQAMEQNPTDTRMRIALINLEKRDFAAAERELNLVVAAKPHDGMARYYLALAFAGQNKVDDVVDAVRRVAPGEKMYVESQLLAAFVLKQESRTKEAASLLETADSALGANPDIRLLNFLVSLYKDSGENNKAISVQKRIIELDPAKDSSYFMLAVLLDEAKDFHASIEAGKKAIELNPRNADALNFVGYSLAENEGNLDEAKRHIEAALQIEPDNGYFIDSLGWVYFKQKQYGDAVRELERAVKLVSLDAVILEHLALAYQRAGKVGKALDTVRKAIPHADKSDDRGVLDRLKTLESSLQSLLN